MVSDYVRSWSDFEYIRARSPFQIWRHVPVGVPELVAECTTKEAAEAAYRLLTMHEKETSGTALRSLYELVLPHSDWGRRT